MFQKMDLNISLDKEIFSYIQNGGDAGGYYHWLALLVRFMQPKCVLELGSRHGISTVMLYSELPSDGHLISVDIDQDQRFVPDEMWRDPRMQFVYGDCLDLNIYRGFIPTNIDIFWTDTVHYYEQVRDEFDIYEPLLSDDSLIIVDDINLNDKRSFFDELPYEKYDLTQLCHSSGFGVIHYSRKEKNKNNQEMRQIQAALRSAAIWKRKQQLLVDRTGKSRNDICKVSEKYLHSIKNAIWGWKEKFLYSVVREDNYSSYKKHHLEYADYTLDKVASLYDWNEKTDLFNHPQNRFLDLINVHDEVRSVAIDIGAGAGWLSAKLSEHFQQVIAIEPSSTALEIARTLFPQSEYPNIEWKIGFSEEIIRTIHLKEPAFFLTGCVLSHLQDEVVEKICTEIEYIAPPGSILAFGELWGHESHEFMWHTRTPSWWQKQLSHWELDFFGPEIENVCGRHKGFHGVKIK